MLQVTEIRIYPVKGLRGRSVAEADVEPWGLAGDRRWMIVDAQGRFVSQREVPRLATVDATPQPGGLRLSMAGRSACEVAVPDAEASLEVAVWRDRVQAYPADPAAARWLGAALDLEGCRLVYMADPATARPVDRAYAGADDRVSFADGFPLRLATTASLADLAARLRRPVPMARFRPNLVLGGSDPWDEDTWTSLRAGGGTEFRVVKPCSRCVVTTVDQDTGIKAADGEPLQTLAGFRRDARGRPIFGQNLIPSGRGRIAVGDAVAVLSRR